MLDVFQFVYKPQLLIADSAEAIANGLTLAYVLVGELAGEFSRVICWVHVLRAVDHKLKPIQEPHRQLIRSDYTSDTDNTSTSYSCNIWVGY